VIAFIHANVVYDLDHLRHFLAWGFTPGNWFTNASEQIIAIAFGAVVGATLWPPLRRASAGRRTASWTTSSSPCTST